MESWQTRVITERDELGERLVKLSTFIVQAPGFRKLWSDEQQMLRVQRDAMLRYHEVLEERIAAWDDDSPRVASGHSGLDRPARRFGEVPPSKMKTACEGWVDPQTVSGRL